MRGTDLKAHDSFNGETPLYPKRLSHNCHHMIRAQRNLRVYPNNSPTQPLQVHFPLDISQPRAR